jgi:hypothetical protein
MKYAIIIAFPLVLLSGNVFSQPAYEPFIKFFKPLVGSWSCSINDYDEVTGKSTWSEIQNREFVSTLNGNYLVEKSYSPHFFEEKHVGLFIYSYDPKSKTILSTGFWVGTAGHLYEIEAQITDNSSCKGKIKIKYEDGSIHEHNVEWKWTSSNEFRFSVFKKGKNGAYYLGEELVYTRKA